MELLRTKLPYRGNILYREYEIKQGYKIFSLIKDSKINFNILGFVEVVHV